MSKPGEKKYFDAMYNRDGTPKQQPEGLEDWYKQYGYTHDPIKAKGSKSNADV